MNRMPVQYNAMLVLASSFGSSKQVFRFEIISQDIRIFRSKTKENHLMERRTGNENGFTQTSG